MSLSRPRAFRIGLSVALVFVARPSLASSQTSVPPTAVVRDSVPKRKSQLTATLISGLVPGWGHFYAQDYKTGTILLTTFAVGVAIGAGGENAVTPVGMVLVAVPWWYGIVTAHTAVSRYNRDLDARLSMAPLMTRTRTGEMMPALGVRLSVTW